MSTKTACQDDMDMVFQAKVDLAMTLPGQNTMRHSREEQHVAGNYSGEFNLIKQDICQGL